MAKKWKKTILEIRIYTEELYNCCRKYINNNFNLAISKMVEQKGMCIHYNKKDYRLIKVYDASIENDAMIDEKRTPWRIIENSEFPCDEEISEENRKILVKKIIKFNRN